MTELGKYHETESLGNNQYQTTIGVKPIAFLQSTGYKRINPNWQDVGDGRFVVDNAPFRVLTYPTGGRRVYPIRDDFDRWIEIGRPRTKVVTQWQEMNHGALACKANILSGSRINTGLDIVHGGHYISWELELKKRSLLGVWKPTDNLLAFPYELMGLDFKGNVLYADGKPVMRMRLPIVFDRGGENDACPVRWEHQTIDGQRCLLYTLPDISGMKRPVVDPTLELQPDAAAGIDTNIRDGLDADRNYGVTVSCKCTSIDRILIKFDYSSIPSEATIVTAVQSTNAWDSTVDTIGVHRSLVAWFEGASNGADPGATDASTWNHKNANSGAPVTWGAVGGLAGTDYMAVATGSNVAPGSGWEDWDVKADVELFLAGTTNFGHWHIGDGVDERNTYSSDHGTAATRPKSTVVYTDEGGAGARLLNLMPFNHKRGVF